jgi:hypothetical protein
MIGDYLLVILLPAFPRFTASGYLFGTLKLFIDLNYVHFEEKKGLNRYGQQVHQYQQNEQSPIILAHRTHK